jgi:hypothetical protein
MKMSVDKSNNNRSWSKKSGTATRVRWIYIYMPEVIAIVSEPGPT